MVNSKPPLALVSSLSASDVRELGSIFVGAARTLAITIRGKTNAGATAGLRVKLRFSPDSKNWDSVDYTYDDLNLDAGNETQETHLIDTPEHGYMVVLVENLDASQPATNIRVWHTTIRWSKSVTEISSGDE